MDAHADSDDEDVRRLRLQSLSDLGRTRRILGRYEEAEPLIKRSIALAEELFGPDSVETAGALNDLGMLYKFNGRFGEAEPLYRRALDISSSSLNASARSPTPALLLFRKTFRAAGALSMNHNQTARGLCVKSKVKAGADVLSYNHNQTITRQGAAAPRRQL